MPIEFPLWLLVSMVGVTVNHDGSQILPDGYGAHTAIVGDKFAVCLWSSRELAIQFVKDNKISGCGLQALSTMHELRDVAIRFSSDYDCFLLDSKFTLSFSDFIV